MDKLKPCGKNYLHERLNTLYSEIMQIEQLLKMMKEIEQVNTTIDKPIDFTKDGGFPDMTDYFTQLYAQIQKPSLPSEMIKPDSMSIEEALKNNEAEARCILGILEWQQYEQGIFSNNTDTMFMVIECANCFILLSSPNDINDDSEINLKNMKFCNTFDTLETAKTEAQFKMRMINEKIQST